MLLKRPFKKGVGEHDKVQASFELKEEVKRVSEVMKFANSRLFELEKLNAAMFNAISKLVDLEGNSGKDVGNDSGGKDYVS